MQFLLVTYTKRFFIKYGRHLHVTIGTVDKDEMH